MHLRAGWLPAESGKRNHQRAFGVWQKTQNVSVRCGPEMSMLLSTRSTYFWPGSERSVNLPIDEVAIGTPNRLNPGQL